MENSVCSLVQTFLQREKYKINSDELNLQLLSHPSYPSLHSITSVLNHFKIEGIALELPRTSDILLQLPNNFIIVSKDKQYALVKRAKNNFNLLFENNKEVKRTGIEFLSEWDGIILGIETPEYVDNNNHISNVPKFSVLIVFLLLLGGYLLSNAQNSFTAINLLFSIIGLGISILVLEHELGYKSQVLNKICNGSNTVSCDTLFESKAAIILGTIKLSDLSFIYFLGITFTWILNLVLETGAGAIASITILSVPITFFSLYYQYYVVKKWCPLCLGIVGVLWVQAFSIFLMTSYPYFVQKEYWLLTFGLIFSSSIWFPLKYLLLENQSLKKVKIDHYKFKKNFDIFKTLLNASKRFETSIPNYAAQEIVLGDKQSSLELLLLTNPQCFYCKSAHTDIDKIISKYSDDVRLVIRFNVNHHNLDHVATAVCCRLLELYSEGNQYILKQAMDDAYSENADLKVWLKKWKQPRKAQAYAQVLAEQQEWSHKNNAYFTPLLLINGKEYPSAYKRDELLFFIEDLIELNSNKLVEESNFVSIS